MLQPGDPNTYTVERTIDIAAPAPSVYELLADFHHWVDWSPWEGMDQAMARTYDGPDSGVGGSYAWEGNRKVGKGRMEIVDAVPAERVDVDLEFIKPFRSRNFTRFALTPAGDADATTVTWTMVGPKTLMTKVMGVFVSMDKMVGKDFDKGLSQLKSLAEG